MIYFSLCYFISMKMELKLGNFTRTLMQDISIFAPILVS
jgi:hypothetical protein